MADANDPRARLELLELLWRGGQRPSRGPKPKLTLDQIAQAAISLADAEGLDALSMQRVATELGYTTMSLYRYVSGKDQLVELMTDKAAGDPPPYTGDPADWRAELEAWVHALWELYLRHPWTLRAQLSTPPAGPHQLAWFEAALRPLTRAGLTGGDAISATLLLLAAVRQFAGFAVDMTAGRARAGLTTEESEAGYDAALREFVDPDRYPALTALIGDGVFQPTGLPDSGIGLDLDFGVHRVLDGIESYVRARREQGP
ncbi:TetR/AcrR family transcriptional regulator [Prauserella muralis]|uniref:TetR family transcriptional regulator n=1 Tax=Prauserella muralis TaxID=588067 RepID=A0A2V4B118_9PSEU|nr:TetR/AcrR family transcriptional regulator [Prauserella muralis]PXY22255.1 TetR family transcriptional regulator [Prauserella muralis]TWE27891.1 TetR family transcriptional regulator [Prauserella muralis]